MNCLLRGTQQVWSITVIFLMLCSQAHAVDYKARYGLKNAYQQLTDNHGDGYQPLYGTRNFRVVLYNVYYRGGANNAFHRADKRANANPLPNDGLENLCTQEFSTAVYFYTTNFNTAPAHTNCNVGNSVNKLNYIQITAADVDSPERMLSLIHDRIQGKLPGPIYGHCWNGWHASGLIAAVALQQFCGLTPKKALDYWITNTDGNIEGYSSIRRRILDFKPFPQWQIDAATKRNICPSV